MPPTLPKELLEGLVGTYPDGSWDPVLLQRTRKELALESGHHVVSGRAVEELTKCFEIELRAILQEFLGEILPEKRQGGEELLGALVESGLLHASPRPEPLFLRVKYVFGERNPAHHLEKTWEWPEFVAVIASANSCLVELRNRASTYPHPVAMRVGASPNPCRMGIPLRLDVTFSDPTSGRPVIDGTMNAKLTLPTESVLPPAAMYYVPSEGMWRVELGTSGAHAGQYTVVFLAEIDGKRFVSKPEFIGTFLPP